MLNVINLLGNMRVNNLGKFNIPFAEGLGTAPSGVVSSILWTSKEWRVVGWNPTKTLYYSGFINSIHLI